MTSKKPQISFPRVIFFLWRVKISPRVYDLKLPLSPSETPLSLFSSPKDHWQFELRSSFLPGVEEVAGWREKFEISDDVDIRVSGPVDRVSDFDVDEVHVYEGFFESDFRDRVPSFVAKVSEALGISPGQLTPPSWRALIAMQNLGDLEGLIIGVAEVLYSYSISPLNGGEGIYHLHPRNRELPVQQISKNERKRHPVFDSRWTEKIAFMRLPGLSPVWRLADVPRVDPSLGVRTIKQVLKLPIERR
ncbi:hypothetical protein F2Q68_00005164 [Brassica cretica]|uniref:Uncharacterized protein n=1 Tax=Brassica cretica TaxID=69181 RepID=A0A8S9JC47_BRACR|nr:hypothetical protein F2Q68_00005164 [Brassica cretica]